MNAEPPMLIDMEQGRDVARVQALWSSKDGGDEQSEDFLFQGGKDDASKRGTFKNLLPARS